MRQTVARLVLGGVLLASAPAVVQAAPANDPFEGFNRSVTQFNDTVDEWALRPLAEGYRKVVPEVIRIGVDNVFNNLSDVWSVVNNALQGKAEATVVMTMRVIVNTTFGFGGLLDWATPMGMERQTEDFGQTLGAWGVSAGPYIVLPLLGPSTLRDTAALPIDWQAGPTQLATNADQQLAITALKVVSTRAGLLSATKMLDDLALDKYTFVRDAYLTRRLNQVYDGNPPDIPEAPEDAEPVPEAAPAASAAATMAPEPAPSASASAAAL
jgi:phospholipid-binding lipoprotein MlaA